MADVVLPRAFVSELIGAENAEQARFTQQILTALGKISPSLVPVLFAHPFEAAITRGVAGFSALSEAADAAQSDAERAAAIDAIGEIIERNYATKEIVQALGRWISATKSEAVTSAAARAIALAGDVAFLEQQRNLLGSKSPSQQRVAAKLVGYGKYRPAVPNLLDLLRDDQLALSDAVLWALGAIGDPAALPKLHRLLASLLRVEHVIEALGKIGDVTSAVRILPVLIEGSTEQREKAAQALATIARKNGGVLLDRTLEQSVRVALERAIDQDPSKLVRFHALLAYSFLGGHLEPAHILTALGAELGGDELDAVSSFFTKSAAKAGAGSAASPAKAAAKKPVPKGRKPI